MANSIGDSSENRESDPGRPESLPNRVDGTTSLPIPSEPNCDADISKFAQEDPKPMFDVHPSHVAAHTWKDFLIQIATISVGLLIALVLEQTVEWNHHRHQRLKLEAQLLEEARHNFDGNQENFAASDAELQWLLSLQADVQAMLARHGKLRYRLR